VKPHPGSITVNIADALQFLTNGFLKSSIHRVVAPPPDQANVDRLGVLYFVRPGSDVILKPVDSPILQKLGYEADKEAYAAASAGLTAGDWVKARVRPGVNKGKEPRSEIGEQVIIRGVKAKYYD
jgi:isopenicillin N synthase-like dioxygenase